MAPHCRHGTSFSRAPSSRSESADSAGPIFGVMAMIRPHQVMIAKTLILHETERHAQ
jgi:hypothetical protein